MRSWLSIIGIVGVSSWLVLASTQPVIAAGSASFAMSPSGGSYAVGSTLSVAVSVTSQSSDNVNAVGVQLSFPTSLSWQSTTLTGPFTLCAQNSHTTTTVSLACAATTAQSGTQAIATINFTVVSTGSAVVAFTSGSDIANTSGSSVWNGALPSSTYTLTSPATTQPATGGSGNSKTSTPSAASNLTPSSSSPTASATSQSNTANNTGSISITVTDQDGKHIAGATVKLDGRSVKTNQNGVANFAGVASGTHQLTISADGKVPYSTAINLQAGENKFKTLKLANATLTGSKWLAIGAVVVVTVIGLAVTAWYIISRRRLRSKVQP